MVFSSPTFLFVFLPVVLVATWVSPPRVRRWVLLLASGVFYAWGVQEFLLVVWGTALLDWAIALLMRRALDADDRRRANLLLALGIVVNLGLLAYYKYTAFATDQLDHLLSLFGDSGVGLVHVALPIGISFFTFEKVSYLVDVWRGVVAPRRDPVDVLLFVSLFPRSIAGPIVRLREIEHQLSAPTPRADEVREGAIRFAHGLAKKVLIADQISGVADAAFAAAPGGDLTRASAWIGALAYTLQLYYDFSGYSDMAIGIGQMLGFTLPENFRRPYTAVSITDFWRRWHITLSRWFRDYVYVPLGGNREGERRTYRNLFVVFVLTGFWHGAAWSFLLWGLWHGGWMLVERRMGWRAVDGAPPRFAWPRRAGTFLIVLVGWVMFRAGSLGVAADYYRAMLGGGGGLTAEVDAALTHQALWTMVAAALLAFVPSARAGGRWLAEAAGAVPVAARVAVLVVVLPIAMSYALVGTFSPFLYFQF